ncbi:permease [Ottowia sp.]|uniref:permease n=1 Tax=Ottowia sp. TaxID=1898956 RepID=UPI00261F9471|nr:permease [Ottowia sp.]
MEVFQWLNNQLLRMDWLSASVRWLMEALGIDVGTRLGGSLHFFVYDVIKIFILLGVLIFAISYVQSHFPPERTRAIVGRFRGLPANTLAALLGTVTPFCSCSSIPLFIGFVGAGLPLGVTFSFLISSPLVDLASVILLASIFNWPIAIAYVAVGVVLAVVGGTLIERAGLQRHIEPFVLDNPIADVPQAELTRAERLAYAREQVVDVFGRVWAYVLVGVAIGALIHNWIPQQVIAALLGSDKLWAVPLATVVGIPMYADIFGTLPIAEALVARGVGLGTVLAFMMAVTALSVPSIILLRQVVRPPLLAVFVGIVTLGIMAIGYLFNAFAYLLV